MKNPSPFRLLLIVLLLAATTDVTGKVNYVVIGVFLNKTNAIHFTEEARKNHAGADYALNSVRQLYFVFVLRTEDVHHAVEEALRLRANSAYSGAWIYHGLLGEGQVHDGIEIRPPSKDHVEVVNIVNNATPDTLAKAAPGSVSSATQPVAVPTLPEAGKVYDPGAETKLFFFKVYTPAGEPREATVEMIDRERKVNSFKGNEIVAVKPFGQVDHLRFDCQVIGYRRVSQFVNYKDPDASGEGIVVDNGQIIVPFELVRLKEGDKAILFNVFFYKDAGIMRPESKYELDGLLTMMNENTKYKIKIHGHTNGNAAGKIISIGDTKNFFSLTGSKDGRGSAKKLSLERANVIRDYLLSEGVAADRMEVKAWGGKQPIHDRDHPQAGANVRVEIEILQD